jgi:hypothetical protein
LEEQVKAARAHHVVHVKLLRVNGNTFDVFHGDEWNDWTRIMVMAGRIRHVNGRRMTPFELAATYAALPKGKAQ